MTASPIELAVFAEFLGTFVFQLFGGTEQTADNNGLRKLLLDIKTCGLSLTTNVFCFVV